jgi:hypothetical protein
MAEKLKMRRSGDGLLPVSKMGLEDIHKLKPGGIYNVRITKQRSRRAHNFYFEVIRRAAFLWPEGVAPCPNGDEDLLRAWLQCKVGKPKRWVFDVEQGEMAVGLVKYIQGEDKYCFHEGMQIDGVDKIVVFAPESIAEDEMDELEFTPLRQAVFEFIEITLGVKIDELMTDSDKAA